MTLDRAIEILELYQQWRKFYDRNGFAFPAFSPIELTEAIDTVVKHFKQK